ncbi:MAG: amidohydrolase [Oscillospiraceae bacterium]|nr:amidohydrolase [Oscillospiraceae bacterium]
MDPMQKTITYINEHAEELTAISHAVWSFAELSLKEVQSAALYIDALKTAGFTVTESLCGIPTAFSGSWGSGKPVIGILGEFDALSGLSQKAAVPYKTPAEGHKAIDPGHGCGHNMLGAASFGAACAIKEYLEQSGTAGTVIFYGCPGEEGGAAKAFLARDGVWKDLDAALTWHPSSVNEVETGTCNSSIQVLYKFKGIAAHAAGNPEIGRSALDAVELMNTGVQYLREHMKSDCRIHYAITNAGGVSPNVVQSEAEVLYMVRSVAVEDSISLQARVDKIAEGAALMTGTTYERVFVDGTANTVPNSVLEKLFFEKMVQVGLPSYTEEELAYAAALKAASPDSGRLPGMGAQCSAEIAEQVRLLSDNGKKALNDFICPLYHGDDFSPGSTDVGDVSWLTPTAQFHAVCEPSGVPGHSWQIVSCGASSIGDKGLLYAAKVLALAGIELFENAELLQAARAEFAVKAARGYTCPIPPDAVPTVIGQDTGTLS